MSAAVTEIMAPVVGRVRAYFAPVDRAARQPTLFDAAASGGFALDTPPAPWIDLGWIADFARHVNTRIEPLRSGTPLATTLQARTEIDATVSFSFESWSKLPLALAAGTQQMNLLTTVAGATAAGSGGTALAAIPLLAGSTASVLQIDPAAAANCTVGGLVAVDADNTGQTGFLGAGVSGACLQTAVSDIDYIRRITLNVARIAAIAPPPSNAQPSNAAPSNAAPTNAPPGNAAPTNAAPNSTPPTAAITLETPLLAGPPVVTGIGAMKLSSVAGFCDREGSSFFQEWSALFVAEGRQGERVLWHYPRLQADSGIGEAVSASPGGFERVRLRAAFRALPVKDPVDGETVVCFRSYTAG